MHRQFIVKHRDIELNRIDDMIIVIKPNRKISVGSHPYLVESMLRIIKVVLKAKGGPTQY